MTNCVVINNLSKCFKNTDSCAISDLSISFPCGKITGLIGPDGAGKSTLIRCIIGVHSFEKGEIKSLNINPVKEKEFLNLKIGYMPQKNGLYEDLTILENLSLYSKLRGVKQRDENSTFEYLLNLTDLKPFKDRLVSQLSGGMRQKAGLACALLGKPELLLLDEPSVGVDPISRHELLKMVKGLESEGMSIIWATAYLDEAENFDECVLLDKGKILYQGKPEVLTSKMEGRVFLTKADDNNNRKLLKIIKRDWINITDAVIQSDYIRIVFNERNNKENLLNLKETKPKFEDAVIDILGGTPKPDSRFSKNFELKNHAKGSVIKADHLVKKYGDFYAVKDNSFEISKGEVFGLIGPNGAGKSTTFKMLCGLAKPTSGQIYIMNENIEQSPSLARSYLGYMAQKFSLYGNLTVWQNLEFFAGIYGLFGKEKNEKIDEMVDLFNFTKYLEHNADELPLGFKQRLALVCATMHNPQILFLDEPTSGVDPLTRREFWDHINALAEKGVTIMVTTHFMDEAEYCDRISLFYKGESIALGSPNELKASVGKEVTMEETFIKLIKDYDQKESEK